MAFKLVVRLGGLCMYVQRENDKRFSVLMPRAAGHCQIMLVPPENLGPGQGKTGMLYPITNTVISLRDRATTEQAPACFVWAADISRYGGGAPVNDAYLTTTTPTGCLAARIDLPYGYWPYPEELPGKLARMRIDGFPDVLHLSGRQKMELNAGSAADRTLALSSVTLYPDEVDNTIEVMFLNILIAELDRRGPVAHRPGEEAVHQQAYYSLLKGWCDTQGQRPIKKGPAFVIDEFVDGGRPLPMLDCPTAPEPREYPRGWRFTDTHNCSAGFGT